MLIKMITGHTRVCGLDQGFLGLPIRDVIINDSVIGKCNAMETAWEPTPEEIKRILEGKNIIVRTVGISPQPMMLSVEE